MKILLIRHGDPDYSIDSLTDKGWKEAELLADKLVKMKIDDFYVSTLGRAKDTASITLQRKGKLATEYPWLREFAPQINRPDVIDRKMNAWDWLPQDWMKEERFFQYDHWFEPKEITESNVKQEYDWVVSEFDKLLAKHGYERDGKCYKVVEENHDTIAIFCHFGVSCVLLSHLLNVSPMILWHGMCAAPSSVTTLTTEERRKGVAIFRMNAFGDISHLYAQDEESAFAARFCECFSDEQRHD